VTAPAEVERPPSLRARLTGARERWSGQLVHVLVAVVVIAQASWLAVLASRGWFYQDDFTFLAQSTQRPLDWSYLTASINDHLAPGARFAFWVYDRGFGLQYGPTIAVRVFLQAVATVLLYRLLRMASQSRWLALAITASYAASPLLVPGTLWLASSTNLLPAQIFVIVAYDAHLRHARTGQLRWSLVSGLALFGGVLFWEKTAVTAVLLVLLSAGWLTAGGVRRRAWVLLKDWLGWLLTLAPLAAFTAYFVIHGYGSSAHALTFRDGARLVWLQWSHSLWPAVIGAPWRWLSRGETFTGVAAPADVTVILGQVAFVLILIAGWRRNRWRGVLVWLLPAVSVLVGEVLVGLGRFQAFGTLSGVTFSYAFDLAVPTALACTLSLGRPRLVADVAPAVPQPEPARPGHRRLTAACALAVVAALVASSVVSAVAWTQRWHDSPAEGYTNRLLAGVSRLGPTANLYDTAVSSRVLPLISPDRYLSDLLSIGGDRTSFDADGTTPSVVDQFGDVRPARFLEVASGALTHNRFCSTLLTGQTTVEVPLRPVPRRGDYFLQIQYFQQAASNLTVTVLGRGGQPIPLRSDSSIAVTQRLGTILAPVTTSAPSSVRVTGNNPGTSICLASVKLGVPVPAAP
jgi:hypothetical protein